METDTTTNLPSTTCGFTMKLTWICGWSKPTADALRSIGMPGDSPRRSSSLSVSTPLLMPYAWSRCKPRCTGVAEVIVCFRHRVSAVTYLFLVRRLRSSLGLDIEDLSVEKLDERIKRYRRGLRLQVDELPNARYQQWQIDNPPPTTFRVYQKGVLRELHPEEKLTIADRFTSWKRRREYQRAPQSGPHHNDEQDSSYELSPLPAQGCEEGQSTSVNSFVSRDGSNFEHEDSISVLQTTASTDITATLRPVRNAVRERTANHSRE